MPEPALAEPVALSRANLARLAPSVVRPVYDLSAVRAGIVHLGPGGFHRAHMARYTHDLMQLRPEAREWGIVGVGLLAADGRMREALAPQNWLYALLERQDDQEVATVIGALREVIHAAPDPAPALAAIDDPGVRIVSLTVTENGYCLNPATKRLDPSHPAIVRDLARGEAPGGAIGMIVEAYRRRRVAGRPAFTALSCDNIQHNGVVLRDAVLAMAALRDEGLASWIEREASFPGTMVDRITPITTPDDIAELAARFGVIDGWPVVSEVFRQWVIEDRFVDGRPAWEAVGAQFVTDVAPYEFMKLRLLNASHLAIACLGQLAGYVHVDETIRDDAFRAYMVALMDRETGPTLPPVPGIDLAVYKSELIDRFANARIKDTLQRINTDAPLNLLLDPIGDRLASGGGCERLTLGLAAWIRRLDGADDRGRPLTITHPQADLLRARAKEGGPDPRPLLAIRSLFGDLIESEVFVANLSSRLAILREVGAHAALAQTLTA
jgi:mannitol 2-dehydrogenase